MSSETPSIPLKKLKIVFLGGTLAGKTSLIHSVTQNKLGNEGSCTSPSTEVETHPAHAGIDFVTKTISVKGHTYRSQLWDTTGNDRFDKLNISCIRGADAIVFVYDVGEVYTFDRVSQLFECAKTKSAANPSVIKILVGNKSSLERKVTFEEGEIRAQEIGHAIFIETNAKEGFNVNEVILRTIDTKYPTATALPESNYACSKCTLI